MDKKRTAGPDQQGATDANFWLRQVSHDRFAATDTQQQPGSEHRLPRRRVGIRKALPCSILVKTGSSYILARKIHDISLDGAYVEMDPAGLVVGQTVDIVIELSSDGNHAEHQISADISRVDEAGVGLRFSSYGDRAYTDLVNFLYAQ
jgi:hypothetical protein